MSRIFWDTNLYIYLFEKNPEFFERTAALHRRMIQRKDELITSAMTVGEIQVGRRRANEIATAKKYRDAIRDTSTVLPFTDKASDLYAQIRENPAIKPADAIQLSCAAAYGVELFVTNDTALHKLIIPGIHFVAPLLGVPI